MLETCLILLEDLAVDDAWAPYRAGSELWSNSAAVQLQGRGAMFPMTIVNFTDHGYPEAPWVLDHPRLDEAALGSMTLLLNESNKSVCEAAERAASPQAVDEAVLSSMYYDVGRMMVERALEEDEVIDGAEFEPETYGHVLAGLVAVLFPNEKPPQVKRRSQSDPALFAAEIAARLQLMANIGNLSQ